VETVNTDQEKAAAVKVHWGMVVLVLIIGYLIGVKFPATGHALLSKVGM